MIKSVYIHIPFCSSICSYCDFAKVYKNNIIIDKYLDALEKEITLYYKGELIKTIYIGGGTPSCLEDYQLDKLFSIVKHFNMSKTYEFTFECNINDISINLLHKLSLNKVNRLSIGIESFNEKLLKIMKRENKDVKDKIKLAKTYFHNINIDLIYGVNKETMLDLKTDLDSFLTLDVPHISIYSLILEDHTMLKVNNYQELDYDLQRKMYDYIRIYLKKHGYIHYEISNFAKKGYSSNHNLTYWNNDLYYGFGVAAGGYINNVRYTNTRSITNYINGKYCYEEDIITPKIDMENYMILGLRKIKGVSKKDFYQRYNKNISDVFNTSKLCENKTHYYIPSKYLYVSNSILEDFIDI